MCQDLEDLHNWVKQSVVFQMTNDDVKTHVW